VGILSAATKARYSFVEKILMLISLIGLSIPNFWLGVLLIQFFSVRLGILPIIGWGTWQQAVMPTLTLGVTGMAIIARMTSNSLTEVLSQDYIRTAHAKGAKNSIIVFKHALKNALIPVVTVVGLQFGSLLGGAVVTESIFAINGLGRLIVDSIRAQDFPLLQGTVLIFALLFVVVNFLVDISYRLINKRMDLN
ncbi:MAG: ABC transporter permease, partial [Defluviitaleaceae bacterium]|nr:ABC transporter permease [Defluviitaleaceae bacterium]